MEIRSSQGSGDPSPEPNMEDSRGKRVRSVLRVILTISKLGWRVPLVPKLHLQLILKLAAALLAIYGVHQGFLKYSDLPQILAL